MVREWHIRIKDILDASSKIFNYTKGLDLEQLQLDIKAQKASMYNFIVISEAAKNLPDHIKEKYSNIPWKKFIDLGDLILEEYWKIKLNVVWEAIQNDLPPLIPQLENILRENL